MRLILLLMLLLMLLPLLGEAQALSKDKTYIFMSVEKAAVVDYWARLGILSGPYINSMEWELKLKDQDRDFKDMVIGNLKDAQLEYRSMIEKCASNNQSLITDLTKTKESLEIFKDKNRKKGQIIATGAGVAIVLIVLTLKG